MKEPCILTDYPSSLYNIYFPLRVIIYIPLLLYIN